MRCHTKLASLRVYKVTTLELPIFAQLFYSDDLTMQLPLLAYCTVIIRLPQVHGLWHKLLLSYEV